MIQSSPRNATYGIPGMLWTDCKLDQFVNGRLLSKSCSQLTNSSARFLNGTTLFCIVESWPTSSEKLDDQFINQSPGYKLIIQFLNWLACFQLYKTKWSRLETGPNGLKPGRTAWKLAEWFTSSPNAMHKAVQAYQTNSPWPEWQERRTNDLLKHTSKIVSQVKFNQRQRGSDTEIDPCWCWLGLACETKRKAKTNMKELTSLIPRLCFAADSFQ